MNQPKKDMATIDGITELFVAYEVVKMLSITSFHTERGPHQTSPSPASVSNCKLKFKFSISKFFKRTGEKFQIGNL